MHKIVAVLCVRMGSERFPGKVMNPLNGRPHLGHLIDRTKQIKGVDGIVVAIPDSAGNDVIAEFSEAEGIPFFRGSEEDVLGRVLGALEQENADVGIEIYGDGPIIDPKIVEELLEEYKAGDYDFVGNDMKATYPSGMYAEVFSVEAFRDSSTKTDDPAIREHATLYLRQHPETYKLKNIEAKESYNRPDIHLDIDTPEDAEVIEKVIVHFAPRTDYSLDEILQFLDEHPEIAESNIHVHRRWKQYQKT